MLKVELPGVEEDQRRYSERGHDMLVSVKEENAEDRLVWRQVI